LIPTNLGLELDVLPTQLYFRYQALFPQVRMVDASHGIRMTRAVKSNFEIRIISEAAHLADRMFAAVPELIQPGKTEVELAGQVEALARKMGHQGLIRSRLWGNELFYGHLMAGASAALPSFLSSPTGGAGVSAAMPQSAGFGILSPGESIVVDYVFVHQGYMSDQTRIFSIGPVPDALRRAHDAMLGLEEMIRKEAVPGQICGAIYDKALAHVARCGLNAYFMGADSHRVRFIGHGVGIGLDEYPFLAKGQDMPLAAGMVIALEPKVIMPGVGVVGIENTHVLSDEGLRPLNRFPEHIHDVTGAAS